MFTKIEKFIRVGIMNSSNYKYKLNYGPYKVTEYYFLFILIYRHYEALNE